MLIKLEKQNQRLVAKGEHSNANVNVHSKNSGSREGPNSNLFEVQKPMVEKPSHLGSIGGSSGPENKLSNDLVYSGYTLNNQI